MALSAQNTIPSHHTVGRFFVWVYDDKYYDISIILIRPKSPIQN